jgi:conjugative transposon TraM protein
MNSDGEEDLEMKKLDHTLDKIIDIQHPDRVKDRIRQRSAQQKGVVYTISNHPREIGISLLDTTKREVNPTAGFYSLDGQGRNAAMSNAIEAIIPENTVLVNGAVLKLRLTSDIYVNGILIPKNNIVAGVVTLDNERLQAEISTIRYNNSLFPVKLEVFDMDGLAGIYIPGAITRDVARQSADNSLQTLELATLDPSLKAQAAAAGISTMKSLIGRKTKQVRVMVKAGYRVLLRDKNIEQ